MQKGSIGESSVSMCLMSSQTYVPNRSFFKVRTISTNAERSLLYSQLTNGEKYRGKSVKVDIPSLDLIAGDRLEPSAALPDVELLPQAALLIQIDVWRCDLKNARVLHESPLLRLPGVGPESFCIDLLHTWHLGPLCQWLGQAAWWLLNSKFLAGEIPWMSADQNRQLSLLQLKASLHAYYKLRRANDEGWKTKAVASGTSHSKCLVK